MPTLKPCHFRAVQLYVLYIPLHVLVMQQQYSYDYRLALIIILHVSILQYNPENTA